MHIIDGYNLLRTIENLDELFEPLSDVQLCRNLSRYLQFVGDDGEIVFDGIGPPDKSGFDGLNNLEVIFSGRETDADSVIESKITASTAPRRLTVVSSDRRIRRAASCRKAVACKSDVFWTVVEKELTRKRPPKEPKGKRWGLTDGETEQWMDVFGIDD